MKLPMICLSILIHHYRDSQGYKVSFCLVIHCTCMSIKVKLISPVQFQLSLHEHVLNNLLHPYIWRYPLNI